jgi:DNA-binding transcriptional LysR family regulator
MMGGAMSGDLDLSHVRSFLAVVDYGGFHRAAQALHLTQPAVSQHIRRLEARVGGPLFVRSGRSVEVSAHGEVVARELREVVTGHDRAVARLTRNAGNGGPFVLGTVEHFADPILPDLLRELRTLLTDRTLQLQVDRSRPLIERLRQGELDAAIVMDPHDWPDPALLASLPLYWWGSPALAGRPLPQPLPLVLFEAPCNTRELTLRHLRTLGVETVIAAESPHLSGVQAAVRAGLGVTLLLAGGDGMRRIDREPLSDPQSGQLWLALADEHRDALPSLLQAVRATVARITRQPPLKAVA